MRAEKLVSKSDQHENELTCPSWKTMPSFASSSSLFSSTCYTQTVNQNLKRTAGFETFFFFFFFLSAFLSAAFGSISRELASCCFQDRKQQNKCHAFWPLTASISSIEIIMAANWHDRQHRLRAPVLQTAYNHHLGQQHIQTSKNNTTTNDDH